MEQSVGLSSSVVDAEQKSPSTLLASSRSKSSLILPPAPVHITISGTSDVSSSWTGSLYRAAVNTKEALFQFFPEAHPFRTSGSPTPACRFLHFANFHQ